MVTLFSGLEAHHPGIGSDAQTHYTNNPAAGSSWLLDHISQEVVWKSKTALPEVAMVAGSGSGRPVCTVALCKRPGHTKATRWRVGGDMHGKEAEMCEIIAKKREARGGGRGGRGGKSSDRGGKLDNNPFRRATNRCAYLIDADTNEAVFVSTSTSSDGTTSIVSPAVANSNTALMALHTTTVPDSWALSAKLQASVPSASAITSTWSFTNSEDNSFENALSAVASGGGDRVPDRDLKHKPDCRLYLTEMKCNPRVPSRYWLDSGASTSLMNEHTDFSDFSMITPHSIRGIGLGSWATTTPTFSTMGAPLQGLPAVTTLAKPLAGRTWTTLSVSNCTMGLDTRPNARLEDETATFYSTLEAGACGRVSVEEAVAWLKEARGSTASRETIRKLLPKQPFQRNKPFHTLLNTVL
ncbi:hypothetical protein FIBSPDRAFT_884266 [Athelia psychrophila]|uniref:Uncharacterized protein n=1 Tax=Athelia psychrophila TaxID=1759441 RepID=A0A166T8X2_9AGAM|nr:hypothetical protein FIBSPDRAFT_884266 [Fibularhizoctonia sp. CBS 109695]